MQPIVCFLHSTACATGKLTGRFWRALQDCCDFVEGHAEHVVQHECEPLRRSSLSSHEQGETNRISQDSCCSGSVVSVPRAMGCDTRASSDSSRRDVRERNMSRQTRTTTVVSRAPRLSILSGSERLTRSQASCTASSASLREPSIRSRRLGDPGAAQSAAPRLRVRSSVTFSCRDPS